MLAAAPDPRADAEAWLRRRYPQIASGLHFPGADPDDDVDRCAAGVFAAFTRKAMAEGRAPDAGLEAMARFSFEFLRLQARFRKTGRYPARQESDLRDEFYARQDVMEGYYLDGLLLTYAFWPNHARLLRFFRAAFAPHLAGARVMEIGVGHGLFALEALSAGCAAYEGLDLSPFSVAYARALLRANGVAADRERWHVGDASEAASEGAYDGAICCEVLEHVADPGRIVATLRRALRPGGRAFVTTVANVAAEDHIYLYADEQAIRAQLVAGGFTVEAECVLPLRGLENDRPRPINYGAVLRAGRAA